MGVDITKSYTECKSPEVIGGVKSWVAQPTGLSKPGIEYTTYSD